MPTASPHRHRTQTTMTTGHVDNPAVRVKFRRLNKTTAMHDPEKHAPHLMRGGHRFSVKIMRDMPRAKIVAKQGRT
jgi:hypothetical protein